MYGDSPMECPKCRDIEKVEFVSKHYREDGIEFELVCQNCGYLIKGLLNYDDCN